MREDRNPGCVPDIGRARFLDVTHGVDTDGDGLADTVVTDDGVDLILLTDLDGDGIADQIVRIGPDAEVRYVQPEADGPPPG